MTKKQKHLHGRRAMKCDRLKWIIQNVFLRKMTSGRPGEK